MGNSTTLIYGHNRTFTPDGRYFPDRLLKRVDGGKRIFVYKRSYFRFARDNGFADEAKFSRTMKPQHYLDVVNRLIKSRARAGFELDEKLSNESENIVFNKSERGRFEISTQEANRQAKLVLGLK